MTRWRHLSPILLVVALLSRAQSSSVQAICTDSGPWGQGVCSTSSPEACLEGCLAGTPWDSLRIELGTAPARVRRQEWTPPTVRNPPWLSGTLLASVYRILAKEMLGYDEVYTITSASRSGVEAAASSECGAITLEGWQTDAATDAALLGGGPGAGSGKALASPLGAVGSEGLYVPSRMPQQSTYYQSLPPSAFPPDGTVGPSDLDGYFPEGSPWGCSAQEAGWSVSQCQEGRWYPTNCGQTFPSNTCAEMYIPLQSWSDGWWEAAAQNLGLNFSAVYTSYQGQVDLVRSAYQEGRDIMYYWWQPDPLTSTYPSQRVMLPHFSLECAASYESDPLLSGVACEREDVALRKFMNAQEAEAQPDLYTLWSRFHVSTAELRHLMSFHVQGGGSHETMDGAACAWLRSEDNTAHWQTWLDIHDPCGTASTGEVWDPSALACVPMVEPPAQGGGTNRMLLIGAVAVLSALLLCAFAVCGVTLCRAMRISPMGRHSVPPGLGPEKTVTLVITDIQGSTSLWDAYPEEMAKAVALHHRCLRAALNECNGYEVATEGDSFKCAFHTPEDAISWAILVQLELLAAPWDPALEDGGMGDFGEATNWADMSRKKTSSRDISHFKSFKDAEKDLDAKSIRPRRLMFDMSTAGATKFSKMATAKDPECAVRHSSCQAAVPAFRGLRVRMGIHTGTANVVGRHDNTRRVTYGGKVAAIAKAVSDVPCGGQIVASSDTIAAIGSMHGLMQCVNERCFGWASAADPPERQVPGMLTVIHLGSHLLGRQSLKARVLNPYTTALKPNLQEQEEIRRSADHAQHHSRVRMNVPDNARSESNIQEATRRSKSYGSRNELSPSIAVKPAKEQQPLLPLASVGLADMPDLLTYAEQLQRSQELVTIVPYPLRSRYWCFPKIDTQQVSAGYHDAPAAAGVTIMFIFMEGWDEMKEWAEVSKRRSDVLMEAKQMLELQVRANLIGFRGYEVEGEDGCFVCAFGNAVDGLEYAVSLQDCMAETPWDPELLQASWCRTVVSNGSQLLSGPRLKIGLCTADALQAQPSMRTGRMEYFGWVMNHAARVAAAAHGGQVLFHEHTRKALDIDKLHHSVVVKYCGKHKMKGINKSINVYQACGPHFWEHSFPPLDTKDVDKTLQPLAEYLALQGGDKRRSSIARLSFASCGSCLDREMEGSEDPEVDAKLENIVNESRKSTEVHRRLTLDDRLRRVIPKRNGSGRSSLDSRCMELRAAEQGKYSGAPIEQYRRQLRGAMPAGTTQHVKFRTSQGAKDESQEEGDPVGMNTKAPLTCRQQPSTSRRDESSSPAAPHIGLHRSGRRFSMGSTTGSKSLELPPDRLSDEQEQADLAWASSRRPTLLDFATAGPALGSSEAKAEPSLPWDTKALDSFASAAYKLPDSPGTTGNASSPGKRVPSASDNRV